MLHELQTISMRSNVWEWTRLLVNKSWSYLHSFCATGVSSGLAAKWPWLECYGGGFKCLLDGRNLILISFLYPNASFSLRCILSNTVHNALNFTPSPHTGLRRYGAVLMNNYNADNFISRERIHFVYVANINYSFIKGTGCKRVPTNSLCALL
jgi:hypothetical protein